MSRKAVGFCVLVGVLGIIAAALGFAAEITRTKASDFRIVKGPIPSCEYSSSPSHALGIISAAFAVITQVCISAFLGGCWCCRCDPRSTVISKFLSILSWVATVLAALLLSVADYLGQKVVTEIDTDYSDYNVSTCYVTKPRVFAAGAVSALLSAVFGIAAFVTATTQTTTDPAVEFQMSDNNIAQTKYPVPSQQVTQG